jgi:hypothetical protein
MPFQNTNEVELEVAQQSVSNDKELGIELVEVDQAFLEQIAGGIDPGGGW